jgi:L-fucose isomerase-like protein
LTTPIGSIPAQESNFNELENSHGENMSKLDQMKLERQLDAERVEVKRLRARVKELECKCGKQKRQRSIMEKLYYDLIERVQKGLS